MEKTGQLITLDKLSNSSESGTFKTMIHFIFLGLFLLHSLLKTQVTGQVR